ncbi:hypothetical protein Q9L58_001630 [Maublancomyces gigas]|uniref:Uncharacterized protein n=1 Tax=Discina gigas TaxID=1032678 RepID=A0ABR3GTZ0_9PEZI
MRSEPCPSDTTDTIAPIVELKPPSTPRSQSRGLPLTPRSNSRGLLTPAAEPKSPSTPRSHSRGLHLRTRSQFLTPPSRSPTTEATGSPKTRGIQTPISPTAQPRRKGRMSRQMAFSQGSPTIFRAQKSLDFSSALETTEPVQTRSPPDSPGLDIDKELSILFEDSISSWLPTTGSPTREKTIAGTGRKKEFSPKTLRSNRVKKRLAESTRASPEHAQMWESMARLSFACDEDDTEKRENCAMDG